VLAAAERAYVGDVFADDPYPPWAQPLRSEARTTYLHVLRVLVDMAERAGDVDDVVRYLHRILAIDPYDEQAHRDLVNALTESGRHGEASRAFRRYTEAMNDIGVPLRTIPGATPAIDAQRSL
jgi:DNA-binding SARP family transcriptional activator